ncbi:hypothetical protein FOL47_008325 [Perkinsus chesapeaki]|uniref:Uncharacterized protein n=1 Tax=Perkinsus chesapeaki TaxID=330153 RepID=A0A7J6LEN2_PERCH|nr:hypothetical protein FOL47_008325 [Perkinsus chesapeaki]
MTRSRLTETFTEAIDFNNNSAHFGADRLYTSAHGLCSNCRPRSTSNISLKWMSDCHPSRLSDADLGAMDPDAAVSPSTVASVTVSPPMVFRHSKNVTFGDQVAVRFYNNFGEDRKTMTQDAEEKPPYSRGDEKNHSADGIVLDTDTMLKSFDGHSSRVVQGGGAVSEFTDLRDLQDLASSMGERPRPSIRNRSRTCATDLDSFMMEENSRSRYRSGGRRRRFYSDSDGSSSDLDVDDSEEALLARMEAMACDQDLL